MTRASSRCHPLKSGIFLRPHAFHMHCAVPFTTLLDRSATHPRTQKWTCCCHKSSQPPPNMRHWAQCNTSMLTAVMLATMGAWPSPHHTHDGCNIQTPAPPAAHAQSGTEHNMLFAGRCELPLRCKHSRWLAVLPSTVWPVKHVRVDRRMLIVTCQRPPGCLRRRPAGTELQTRTRGEVSSRCCRRTKRTTRLGAVYPQHK